MKHLSIAVLLLFASRAVAGAEKCFTNLAGYNEVKADLPASFQKNPLYLKCANCGSPTGISVSVTDRGILSTMLTGGAPDQSPVKKICINGPNKLTIHGNYTLPVTANGDSVVIGSPIGNYNLTVTTAASLQQHLASVRNPTTFGNGNR